MKFKVSFIIVFLLILTAPFVFLDTKSIKSVAENKNLEPFPAFIKDNKFNLSFLGNFEIYINDRFRFKTQLVWLYSYINFNMLNRIGNRNIVLGKNNWVFLSGQDNLYDFLKIKRVTNREIQHFNRQLAARADWCNKHGIKLLILIAPDKHNVYPELFPFERPSGQNSIENFLRFLPKPLKELVVYPKDFLVFKKNEYPYPLYFETDSHWNEGGGFLAYSLLEEKIKSCFPDIVFPKTEYSTTVNIGLRASDMLTYCPSLKYYTTYVNITPQKINDAAKNTNLPRTVLICDSFFEAMEPFSRNTLNVIKSYNSWFGGFRPEYCKEILELQPDIIVWEAVERSMLVRIPSLSWN
jgi:hypothetical protein